jgi:hypothetical protein
MRPSLLVMIFDRSALGVLGRADACATSSQLTAIEAQTPVAMASTAM